MVARSQVVLRAAITTVLLSLSPTLARADSWGPREDVGVAAVDTRTGKVLWEAWRADEIPAGASDEQRAAVLYLLAVKPSDNLPAVPLVPDAEINGLVIPNAWPAGKGFGESASEGKSHIYYRREHGVIALDRRTKKEVWRIETTRFPYPSTVLEVGDNFALIQIGSHVPVSVHAALGGGDDRGRLTLPNLEPHTPAQRVAAAVFLHAFGDGYLRPEVRKLAARLREEKNDPAAKVAAAAVEKLLVTWPAKRDPKRLLDACVAFLVGADDGNPFRGFAWPGAHRVLAWCLLQELVYGRSIDGYSHQGYNYAFHDGWTEEPVALPDATRAKLADACRRAVAVGPDRERPFAASLLVSTAIGWGRTTDAERKALLLSADPSAWRWAALALAKNGRREQLMEWVRARPADDHLDVLWVVRHDRTAKWSDADVAFALACARHNINGVASLLNGENRPLPLAFRGPIREFLLREIAAPTARDGGGRAAGGLFAAVYLLDSWKNPDDTPLLLEYLKHPLHNATTRFVGAQGTEHREYRLRGHVRVLLEKRGVKIPPGVVYEENVRVTKG